MDPIAYNEAVTYFNDVPVEIPTLGRNSSFNVTYVDDQFSLTNSRNRQYPITLELWNRVMTRMELLPIDLRQISKPYTRGHADGYWAECPHQVLAVYIPAIVRWIHEQNTQYTRHTK